MNENKTPRRGVFSRLEHNLRGAAVDSEIIMGILVPRIVSDARLVFARRTRRGIRVSLSARMSARSDVYPFATGLSDGCGGVGTGNPCRAVPLQNLPVRSGRKRVLFRRREIHRAGIEFEHRIHDAVPGSGRKRRSRTGLIGCRKARGKRGLRYEKQREAERHPEREEESPCDDR